MARNRYEQIIEHIFLSRYQEGMHELEFLRQDIIDVAQELGVVLPKLLEGFFFLDSDDLFAI